MSLRSRAPDDLWLKAKLTRWMRVRSTAVRLDRGRRTDCCQTLGTAPVVPGGKKRAAENWPTRKDCVTLLASVNATLRSWAWPDALRPSLKLTAARNCRKSKPERSRLAPAGMVLT